MYLIFKYGFVLTPKTWPTSTRTRHWMYSEICLIWHRFTNLEWFYSFSEPEANFGQLMKFIEIVSQKCYVSASWTSMATQQNSYSISHLLGTVTSQLPPLWRCNHCSLVPNTVTTEQWLHWTHVIRYPLPWGICRNLSTRHLVGNCSHYMGRH